MKKLDSYSDWIQKESKQTEYNLESQYRKQNGCFYTEVNLALHMVHELFIKMNSDQLSHITDIKFLEPCVGSGIFVYAYLVEVDKLNLGKKDIEKVIDNIYVADVSDLALKQYARMITTISEEYFGIKLQKDYFKTHCANGLLLNMNESDPHYVPISAVFPSVKKFDIVITNPPYKSLKAERNQFETNEGFERNKHIYSTVKSELQNYLQYSLHGVLNLYRLFVEEIVLHYSTDDAWISLLIPNTILTDQTCMELRTYLLEKTDIQLIEIISENNDVIDANQGLCVLLLKKGNATKSIRIVNDYTNNPDKYYIISIDDIVNQNNGNAITSMNEKEYSIMKQLSKFPRISDYPFIHNLRGELDLTQFKDYITTKKTPYKLVRGRNIKQYQTVYENAYVKSTFLELTKKKPYVEKQRLICQQICNMKVKPRLKFAIADSNTVLGNSCNFISVDENDAKIDIFYLLGILNTSIIDWFFCQTSSNNHISNYQIGNLPIIDDPKIITKISKLMKSYLGTNNNDLLKDVEKEVNRAFDIMQDFQSESTPRDSISRYVSDMKQVMPTFSPSAGEEIMDGSLSIEAYLSSAGVIKSFDYTVLCEITRKYLMIKDNIVINHTTSKLSDLDLEMVTNIPPGGNWRDLPESIIKKSKRLMQMKASGGRTTLYGRIDEQSPSYTISTYFNRPGNGTFIHPKHDRLISAREAARFQSFPDSYYFTGSKGEVLKQIGNAVPVLMAEAIGQNIKKILKAKTSLDLFAGAGGLTYGFKKAGIKTILATDFNEPACVTLKVNNPEIPVLCGDVTRDDTKRMIIDIGKKKEVDIICGGPPCQGFSLAGKRFIDDPRNQLFKEFVEIVKGVRPKVVVFENVIGILTMDHGLIYKQIVDLFSGMGYNVEGRVLTATDYGVPQKRKRVILIGVDEKLKVPSSKLYPPVSEKPPVTAKDVLSDLENVECNSDSRYDLTCELSDYQSLMLKEYRLN